ncbi:hypothetical protein [Saprospira grandis]|uniref:hypothetical protein n=1 Tax=Saprospira grandis TaxID=1008 RepID=UPI0022DDE274|nr:hypothetical protein [Saprospira grandis]WBM75485.1 hypothetical protein OP864_04400 [Saprospira grandis]
MRLAMEKVGSLFFYLLKDYLYQTLSPIRLYTKVYLIDNQSDYSLTIVGWKDGQKTQEFIPLGPNGQLNLQDSQRYCKTSLGQSVSVFINGCYTSKRIKYINGQATLIIKNSDYSSF